MCPPFSENDFFFFRTLTCHPGLQKNVFGLTIALVCPLCEQQVCISMCILTPVAISNPNSNNNTDSPDSHNW